MMRTFATMSEEQLQAELNVAVFGTGRRDVSESFGSEGRSRIAEVRMIQEVEELGAELQFQTLFDREILEQRVIDVEQARPMQNVAARVAIDVDVLDRKSVV